VKPVCHSPLACFLPIIALQFLLSGVATAQNGGVPAFHLEHLKRGINIGRFLNGELDNPAISTCTKNGDGSLNCTYNIDAAAALGLDHVRVLLKPGAMFKPGSQGVLDEQSAALSNLDRLVQQILNRRMGLVLTLSLEGDQFKNRLGSDSLFLEQLKTFWQQLAHHYSAPAYLDYVFFEILNEPGLDEPLTIEQWSGPKPPPEGGIQAALAHTIRAGAPQSTILATGGERSDLNGLLALQPFPDIDNIVYVIHYYEPFTFTHQGADWGDSDAITHLKAVPYPYSPEPAEKAAMNIQNLSDKMNAWHDMEMATKDRINTDFEITAEWARQNGNVPVICDEFGVYKKFSPPYDRAAWVTDVRNLLEKKGIGWTFWDYSSPSFGLLQTTGKPNQYATLDKDVVTALGLSVGSN